VPAAECERIFERFYRGDSSRAAAGAGIGLALVRSIVALHGGRITLESSEGQGACFRVVIPIRHGA
jgi:signal transduction histidine kinase